VSESNTEGSGDEERPVAKKPKLAQFQTVRQPPVFMLGVDKHLALQGEAPSDESTPIIINTNAEGEKYIDLGKKKRVTVRTFKGMPLIDIREFYGADGDEKPGKKGISLQPDQVSFIKFGC